MRLRPIGPIIAAMILIVAVWAVFFRGTTPSPALANEPRTEQPDTKPAVTPPGETPTQAEPSATFTPLPTVAPTLLPPELPPRGADAQFDTDFTRHSVPYGESSPVGRRRTGYRPSTNPSSSA